MGSHLIQNRKELAIEIIRDLKLAHFPVRSIKQIKSKIFTAWINNLSRHNRKKIQCWHWEQLFEKFKNDEEVDQNDLIQIAKRYCSREKTNDNITTLRPIDFSFCESLEI